MLVGSHDRRVDHGVSIVGIVCQDLEKTLPNAAHGPARETLVRIAPAAKTFRQIAPRCPYTEFPDHGIDEKTIAQIAVAPDRSLRVENLQIRLSTLSLFGKLPSIDIWHYHVSEQEDQVRIFVEHAQCGSGAIYADNGVTQFAQQISRRLPHFFFIFDNEPFSAVSAEKKNDKWYLTVDETKDSLNNAAGYQYNSSTTSWSRDNK